MIKESDGKHFDHNTNKRENVYCPCNGWDCPYYEKGICYIHDPMEECDDWGMFWESWEEWENAQRSLLTLCKLYGPGTILYTIFTF